MSLAAKRAAYFVLSIVSVCPIVAAQSTQGAKVQHYLEKANREAWGIVDPEKQILLSGRLAAIQGRTGDLAGVRDTRLRIIAAQRKVSDAFTRTMAEAELAIAAWNLSDKEGFASHLASAKELADTCPPGQQAAALRVVMTAELKGQEYASAIETAKKLHQVDAGTTAEVARLFGDLLPASSLCRWRCSGGRMRKKIPTPPSARRSRRASRFCW